MESEMSKNPLSIAIYKVKPNCFRVELFAGEEELRNLKALLHQEAFPAGVVAPERYAIDILQGNILKLSLTNKFWPDGRSFNNPNAHGDRRISIAVHSKRLEETGKVPVTQFVSAPNMFRWVSKPVAKQPGRRTKVEILADRAGVDIAAKAISRLGENYVTTARETIPVLQRATEVVKPEVGSLDIEDIKAAIRIINRAATENSCHLVLTGENKLRVDLRISD